MSAQELGDGSVVITDPAGTVISTIEAPWAKDAVGKSIPTHYTWSGDILTQHIDLSGPSISYPVVADPSFSFSLDLTALVTPYTARPNPIYQSAIQHMSTASAMRELHNCFNCSFPIPGAPKSFPSVGQNINLNGNPFLFPKIPAPVTVTGVGSTAWIFKALPGHFDGTGSTIGFQFYNDNSGLLHISITSYIAQASVPNEDSLYPSAARIQWQPLINNVAHNAYADGFR